MEALTSIGLSVGEVSTDPNKTVFSYLFMPFTIHTITAVCLIYGVAKVNQKKKNLKTKQSINYFF